MLCGIRRQHVGAAVYVLWSVILLDLFGTISTPACNAQPTRQGEQQLRAAAVRAAAASAAVDAGTASSFPSLFRPAPAPSAVTSRAKGVQVAGYTGQLPSSAVSSYVYLSDFMDTTLPEQLQLTLPLGSSDTPQPVMVVHRADVHSTGVWVGELQVAPGPLSVVTLVLTEDTGTVLYGDAIYWDPEVAKMRTVMVAPVLLGTSGTASATGRGDNSMASTAAHAATTVPGADTAALAASHGQISAGSSSSSSTHQVEAAPAAGFTAPQLHAVVQAAEPDRPEAEPLLPYQRLQRTAGAVAAKSDGGTAGTTSSSSGGWISDSFGTRAGRRLQQSTLSGRWQNDLLVVVTPAALEATGGSAAVTAAVAMAVAKANKAYIDSDVNVQLNLLGVRQVDYTEPAEVAGQSPQQILQDITGGKVPDIQRLRDELSADLVVVFNNDSTTCGIAWSYNIQSDVDFNMDHGYAAIMAGCWRGYVLAHEVAHMQGCGHLWENEYMYMDTLPYGFGFYRCNLGPSRNFQDIMAVAKCPNSPSPAVLGLYANPMLTVFGVPAGDPSKAFCARALNETAPVVARYRSAGCQPGTYWCEASQSCIFVSTCCSSSDCTIRTYKGDVHCPGPGQECVKCSTIGQKQCGGQCIDPSTCCADPDDCTAMMLKKNGGTSLSWYCPGAGSSCAVNLTAIGINGSSAGDILGDNSTDGDPGGSSTNNTVTGDPTGGKSTDSSTSRSCPATKLPCRINIAGSQSSSTFVCINATRCCMSNRTACVLPQRCTAELHSAVWGICKAPAPAGSKCPRGRKPCGKYCILQGRCCTSADCAAQKWFRRCPGPGGRCSCPEQQKVCNGKCTLRTRINCN